MTTREKELRTLISSECFYNGWMSDYNTSCDGKYDFIRCPDSFECMQDYIKDLVVVCYELGDKYSCEQCWKKFLNGD